MTEAAPPRPLHAFASPRVFLRTCLLYLLLVLLFTGGLILPVVQETLIEPFLTGLATVVTFILGGLGVEARSHGTDIIGPDIAVKIVSECSGIEALILLSAAILVFPTSWRARGIGLGIALGVMVAVNLVRIVSLCWVGTWSQTALEIGHLYVWPVLVMLAGLATLFVWVQRHAVPQG